MIAVADLPEDLSRAPRNIYPCSQAQLRFWFEEQLHPNNPGLNIAVRWRLEGELSDSHLDAAWQFLVARHGSLRTSFETIDGEPAQVVERAVPLRVQTIDFRALNPAEAVRAAAQLAEAEARKPFDLNVAPLIRVTRLTLSDSVSELLVTAHHTICDGWSIGVLAHEMGVVCAAFAAGVEPDLPDLRVAYGQYAAWERAAAQDGSLGSETSFARELLRGYKQFELLPDWPRPAVQTANGTIVSILLDRALTDGLTGVARANGCTLFMTALAALTALLARYSGESDIALGTQVVGRDEVEFEGVVGCFINTIALRSNLGGDPAFIDLLDRTRETVTDAFDIRHLPLEALIDIVKPKRDLSRNALFSVNFIFQRSFIENRTYGTFDLVDLPSRSAGALYDLNFFMVERPEGWRIACEYNTDLFAEATVAGLLARFENVLHAVVADPTQALSRIPVLSAADRRELVVTRNATQRTYPAHETVLQLFAAQAARTPDRLAASCGGAGLTYAQLDAASNRLAHELSAQGLGPGLRAGVLLDRSEHLLTALLAVLKSGAAYVPLDPAYPRERLAYIAEQAGLSLVITRSALRDRVDRGGFPAIDIDADAARIAAQPHTPLGPAARPADIAYVIYTSGSTGRPKGVQISHRALTNFLCAMRDCPGLDARDTLVAVTTVSFDIAGLELFLPLIVGAKLVIATEAELSDGEELLALVRRSAATIVQATPVMWQLLIEAGWNGDPQLKMLCGGEALPRPLAEALLARGGELWNMYGPTETTIWSAVSRVQSGSGPVTIGRPIANTQFYVLDPRGDLVPPGAPGELYIGGDGVADGYFGRDDLTAERFVPDAIGGVPGARLYRTGDLVRARHDGTLEFLGRTDHQIKLRGFRIELGEIEFALLRSAEVTQAVAIVGADVAGESAIWAYVTLAADAATGTDWPAALRANVLAELPKYMVPSVIVVLPALPRTPNGKIDRNALPAPATPHEINAQIVNAPAGATEIVVAGLIAQLLGREGVGRHDDIFSLGFHSLLAVRLVARIAQALQVKLPLRALFDNPSVAALAIRIDGCSAIASVAQTKPHDAQVVTYNANGSRTPLFYFHNDVWFDGVYCRRLAELAGADQPFYAMAPHGTAGLDRLPSIEQMAHHFSNRIREIQPHGPYRLGGSCAGGLVAYELARILRDRGETVDKLVLVNASAPPSKNVLFGDQLLRRIAFNARLDARLREKLLWNGVRFFDALGSGPHTALRFVLKRLRVLLARSPNLAGAPVSEELPFDLRSGSYETEGHFGNLAAAYTYHPKPFDGEITLIMGTDYLAAAAEPTMGWGALTRGVQAASIPCGFLLPLHDNITALGHELANLLRT